MSALREKQKDTEQAEEFHWARTRALWVPLKNAFFKKDGGGEYRERDLITLSFDKEQKTEKPLSFKEVKAKLGSKIRKDAK